MNIPMYMYTLYRVISRNRLVANRQFVVIALAETIRTWWNNPKIAELLRYGWNYVPDALQRDVQDGDMWKEFVQNGIVI